MVMFQLQAPAKRVCLGGRGREWAAESLRMLEMMSEMKDAKIFLEPMDPLKYAVSVEVNNFALSSRSCIID